MSDDHYEFEDKEWGTDRPATTGVNERMNEEEKQGVFGWVYDHRETIVVEFLKYMFGIGISLLYFALLITIADFALKWLIASSPEFDFAWKIIIFALGLTLVVAGLAIVVWFIIMAYYLRWFKWFRDRLEFIDPVRRMD